MSFDQLCNLLCIDCQCLLFYAPASAGVYVAEISFAAAIADVATAAVTAATAAHDRNSFENFFILFYPFSKIDFFVFCLSVYKIRTRIQVTFIYLHYKL